LFKGSIGRTDFPRGDHAAPWPPSAKTLPLGDDVRFVPGHGAMSRSGERRDNPSSAWPIDLGLGPDR
jgi:glyoxylase-like metal-dependent hydrolase (beta-lactamase superfamily II)